MICDRITFFNVLLIPDESGSDSESAESTSSSYSSLSDFVIDIQNSDINGETPGRASSHINSAFLYSVCIHFCIEYTEASLVVSSIIRFIQRSECFDSNIMFTLREEQQGRYS